MPPPSDPASEPVCSGDMSLSWPRCMSCRSPLLSSRRNSILAVPEAIDHLFLMVHAWLGQRRQPKLRARRRRRRQAPLPSEIRPSSKKIATCETGGGLQEAYNDGVLRTTTAAGTSWSVGCPYQSRAASRGDRRCVGPRPWRGLRRSSSLPSSKVCWAATMAKLGAYLNVRLLRFLLCAGRRCESWRETRESGRKR